MPRRCLSLRCGAPLLLLLVNFVGRLLHFFRKEYMILALRLRSNFVSFTLAPLLMLSPLVLGRLPHPPFHLPPFMPIYASAPHMALPLASPDGRILCFCP